MQQTKRRYQMAEFGRAEEENRGRYLLKPGRGSVWRPAWGDGQTTIRILPVRNLDNPAEWEPFKLSPKPMDFGDWIRKYPVCRNMGETDPVTFIMYDPADVTLTRDQMRMTPGWLLFRAIDRAIANGQEQPGWGALLKGGVNRSAPLSMPTEVYLVQCFVMQYGTTVFPSPRGFAADDQPIVMEITRSAGQMLLEKLDETRPDYDGPAEDWERSMLHGDPVSIDYGRFVTFYNLSNVPLRQSCEQNWSRETVFGCNGWSEHLGVGVDIDETFNGLSANLRDYEDVVASKVQPWDDILYFPSFEEQARMLADKFPPSAILYAWRDFPEWIPESVRRRAVNARTFPAPNLPYQTPVAGGWQAPTWGGPVPAAPVPSVPDEAPWGGPVPGAAAVPPTPASIPTPAASWGAPAGQNGPSAAGLPAADPALPSGAIPDAPVTSAAPEATPPWEAPAASPEPTRQGQAVPGAVPHNWGQPLPAAAAQNAASNAAVAPRPIGARQGIFTGDLPLLPPEPASGAPVAPSPAQAVDWARRAASR